MTSESTRDKKLEKLLDDVIHLKKSPLYTYRIENNYLPVMGEGSSKAQIMFIGEAPGRKEAETGRPFVGMSGKILDELLLSIQLNREDVFITSIVKDRPQKNRDPLPEEIAIYSPFLDEQINIIQPKIIANLGRISLRYILEKYNLPEKSATISTLHGHPLPAKTLYGDIYILPLYHPAVALYNGHNKTTLFADFKQIPLLLQER